MDFTQIVILLALAALYILLLPGGLRAWALMIGSTIAIYWLQPTLTVRWLDYSLPTATLLLTMGLWWITKPAVARHFTRSDGLAAGLVLAVIIGLALTRYFSVPDALQLTSRPPELPGVVLAVLLGLGLAFSAGRFAPRLALLAGLVLVIGLLIVLQTPPLAAGLAGVLRAQAGQDVTLATGLDIGWLGFSYIAFRLIHTVRDRQTGILPDLSLRAYVTYVVFAPAYASGPIDRAERFQSDLLALPALQGRDAQRITVALGRITMGLFKKFVLADSLALFALDAGNAAQASGAGALWVMLYGYGLRLFLDFSGYTDIAIGIGLLFGITLPENFNRPYLKSSITTFWQAWHISLTNWVRFYVFSPLSRMLLRREPKPPTAIIMLICHLTTMLIIGAWHGVTLPFLLWGAWHGLGLWIHKLWTDRTRKWYIGLKARPRTKQAWSFVGWLLTFHFVMLGWVWFSMPTLESALRVFGGLFGVTR